MKERLYEFNYKRHTRAWDGHLIGYIAIAALYRIFRNELAPSRYEMNFHISADVETVDRPFGYEIFYRLGVSEIAFPLILCKALS